MLGISLRVQSSLEDGSYPPEVVNPPNQASRQMVQLERTKCGGKNNNSVQLFRREKTYIWKCIQQIPQNTTVGQDATRKEEAGPPEKNDYVEGTSCYRISIKWQTDTFWWVCTQTRGLIYRSCVQTVLCVNCACTVFYACTLRMRSDSRFIINFDILKNRTISLCSHKVCSSKSGS